MCFICIHLLLHFRLGLVCICICRYLPVLVCIVCVDLKYTNGMYIGMCYCTLVLP